MLVVDCCLLIVGDRSGQSAWGLGFGGQRRAGEGRPCQRFRDGLVFMAHRLLYHSTLGSREIRKERKTLPMQREGFSKHLAGSDVTCASVLGSRFRVYGVGFTIEG